MIQRTKCEVYSRVVGYLRPISNWNDGKKAEWEDRLTFKPINNETQIKNK